MSIDKTKNLVGKTCIIYCRVSSKEQIKGTSLDEQEIICMDFAKKTQNEREKNLQRGC